MSRMHDLEKAAERRAVEESEAAKAKGEPKVVVKAAGKNRRRLPDKDLTGKEGPSLVRTAEGVDVVVPEVDPRHPLGVAEQVVVRFPRLGRADGGRYSAQARQGRRRP